MNERALVNAFEAASPPQLAKIINLATPEEARVLRAYLGDERFGRMSEAAGRLVARGGPAAIERRGNVVVLPGIMGSELTASRAGKQTKVWLSRLRLLTGWLDKLRLDDQGGSFFADFVVTPSGVINRYYGDLLMRLHADGWNVAPYAYDWRKSLDSAATDLDGFLLRRFSGEPVRLIAHSMGGLVARTLVHRRRSGQRGEARGISQLIMLGTPNFGSYEIPQLITGLQETAELLSRVLSWTEWKSAARVKGEILETLNSFPGSYQMLPYPRTGEWNAELSALYTAATFAQLSADYRIVARQAYLDAAKAHHQNVLSQDFFEDNSFYIAGCNRATVTGIAKGGSKKLHLPEAYVISYAGDGRVPHELGPPRRVAGTFFVEEDHGALPNNELVQDAIESLLTDRTCELSTRLPPMSRGAGGAQAVDDWQQRRQRQFEDIDELMRRLTAHEQRLVNRPRNAASELASAPPEVLSWLGREGRGVTLTIEEGEGDRISPDEVEAETLLAGGFVGRQRMSTAPTPGAGPTPTITIRLAHRQLQYLDDLESPPVDAIALGNYADARPAGSLRDLDRAITASPSVAPAPSPAAPSASESAAANSSGESAATPDGDATGLLERLVRRGLMGGRLGQPFVLPDPRDENRLIAVGNIGLPGRFGKPELITVFKQMVWTLSSLRCKHAATILIGFRSENITLVDALEGLVRGICEAFNDLPPDGRLETITLCEIDDDKVEALDNYLEAMQRRLRENITINYQRLNVSPKADAETASRHEAERRGSRRFKKLFREASRGAQYAVNEPAAEDISDPTRVVVMRADDHWSFSAMTRDASIPERIIDMDTSLVQEVISELAGNRQIGEQIRYGASLEAFLIPKEFRDSFYGEAPLVMIVDAATARVPWEMMLQPHADLFGPRREVMAQAAANPRYFPWEWFVGTSRGLTRQLRTQFARPVEASTFEAGELDRTIRVLIVADPSREHPLPGAQQEGLQLLSILSQFNRIYAGNFTVEVKRLIGPLEATRLNVLTELTATRYDVLHYCGHCFFDSKRPENSGWIFSDGKILAARELARVDRVPRFVFSNACESGITPERPDGFSPAMAPSFAEAFFRQGVTNFVCTAWPVDDAAALEFATVFYQQLLGLAVNDLATPGRQRGPNYLGVPPTNMVNAMHRARKTVAGTPRGRGTWGAYQHYGDPYFRLLPANLRPNLPLQVPADASAFGAVPFKAEVPTPFAVTGVAGPDPQLTLTGFQGAAGHAIDAERDDNFSAVEHVIANRRDELLRFPGVVAVKAGYRFVGGEMTDTPTVVAYVLEKQPHGVLPANESLPSSITHRDPATGRTSIVPIDVAPAPPAMQLLAMMTNASPEHRRELVARLLQGGVDVDDLRIHGWEQLIADMIADQETRAATAPYEPPARAKTLMKAVEEEMEIVCHNSPDGSWGVLEDFLRGARRKLVIAMYDFTAEHIRDALLEVGDEVDVTIVLCPKAARGHKTTETGFRDELADALGERFQFRWAAVKVKGKTSGGLFANSYHIKVAVRDGKSVWLSSGNWQPQNQPSPDLAGSPTMTEIRGSNREWHVVIENAAIAKAFETFIKHDFDAAEGFQDESADRALGVELEVMFEATDTFLLPRGVPRVFPAQTVSQQVRVEPLLTPDDYAPGGYAQGVIKLIRSAQSTLFLQNQYLTLKTAEEMSDEFKELAEAIREQVREAKNGNLDFRMILRSGGANDIRDMLTKLQRRGIHHRFIRLQDRCHNKGVIADGKAVAVGSQNWSNDGVTFNRDATVIIHNREVAEYYQEVFLYDWENLAREPSEAMVPRRVRGMRGPMSTDTRLVPNWEDLLFS